MKKSKGKNTGKWMALFIAVVMVSSIGGYVIVDSSSSSAFEYNGYEFEREENGYSTEVKGVRVMFHYLPADIDHIEVSGKQTRLIRNAGGLRMTSDVNSTLQQAISLFEFEIENHFARLGKLATHGFTEENSNNLTVITCGDANQENPVIYIKEGESTSVDTEDACIIVTAKNQYDVIKVKDAILYRSLGIIEE